MTAFASELRRVIVRRIIVGAGALSLPLVPAQAYTGNVNPSAWTAPTVMHGAINAQAKRKAARRQTTTLAQRRGCAGKARWRARHGQSDPRVVKLYSICRGIGL